MTRTAVRKMKTTSSFHVIMLASFLHNGYTTDMPTPIEKMSFMEEAQCRLLWRLGAPVDRSWLLANVAEPLLKSWGVEKVKPLVNSTARPVTVAEIETTIRRFVLDLKAQNRTRWAGAPAAFLHELEIRGVVVPKNRVQFVALLGRVLNQWNPEDEVHLVFERQIAGGSGARRTWVLAF
jgi:hypothetical protein